ncbi:MAG: MarR family winged helix-turn-helix transcriptional regulator [Bacillota bacterium]
MSNDHLDQGINSLEEVLRKISYRMNYLTKNYLSREGLTLPRYWVLLNLRNRDGMCMGDLQEHILISAGSLTTLVDGLVEDGLVTRQRSEDDRRLVLLHLTTAGGQLIERALSYRQTLLSQALNNGEYDLPGSIEEMLSGLGKISYFLLRTIQHQEDKTTQGR